MFGRIEFVSMDRSQFPLTQHKKVERDTSSCVTPMDSSGSDISKETSSSDSEEHLNYLEWLCEEFRFDLNLYNTLRKSIIPSLALWFHMTNLEIDKDNELLKNLESEQLQDRETEMEVVEASLRTQRGVSLILYDNWSDESNKEHDGKLINRTTDVTTTIYISRAVFGAMASALWSGMEGEAHLWKNSRTIYRLLDDPLMTKDMPEMEKVFQHVYDNCSSNGGQHLDDFIHMKYVMEPKYHPLIRKAQEGMFKYVWDNHIKKEMWRYRLREFPFSCLGEYSESVRKLFESKLNGSKPCTAIAMTKKIVDLHRQFISDLPKNMLKSKFWVEKLPDDQSRETLRQLCIKSFKELKMVKEHCINMQKFSSCMEKLFERTANDKILKGEIDYEVQNLVGLLGMRNPQGLQNSLRAIKNIWFHDLSDDYVVQGILLYNDAAALSGDKLKEFVRIKVTGAMKAKCLLLYKVWSDSCCYEKAYRDNDDPARVISWSNDDEREVLECDYHSKLRDQLKCKEEELKKLEDMLPSGSGMKRVPRPPLYPFQLAC